LLTGNVYWNSDTTGVGTAPFSLEMQTDCNLVLYDSSHIASWSSDTIGQGIGCRLVIQNDGNIVIYDSSDVPVWASDTEIPPSDRLIAFNYLNSLEGWDFIESLDDRFTLTLQDNGDLVGLDTSTNVVFLEFRHCWCGNCSIFFGNAN